MFGSVPSTKLQSFADIFPFGPTANLGIQHQVFDDLGGFDEDISVYEDLDLCLRTWMLGHHLQFVPECVGHYRLRDTMGALWKQAVSSGEAAPFIARKLKGGGYPVSPRLRG